SGPRSPGGGGPWSGPPSATTPITSRWAGTLGSWSHGGMTCSGLAPDLPQHHAAGAQAVSHQHRDDSPPVADVLSDRERVDTWDQDGRQDHHEDLVPLDRV